MHKNSWFLTAILTVFFSVGLFSAPSLQALFDDDNPYFSAIKTGDLETVEFLILSGEDMEHCDEANNSALMAASYYGDTGIMKALLEAGADVDAFNNEGDTALMFALWDPSPKTDAVKLLLKFDADIEVMNDNGMTPLILATRNNHKESLLLLIRAGADLEVQGKHGRTALAYAAEHHRMGPARVLIDAGADVEARDEYSLTPLMLTSFGTSVSLTKLLIRAGADVNARTFEEILIYMKGDHIKKGREKGFFNRPFFRKIGAFFSKDEDFIPAGSTALYIARVCGGTGVQQALMDAGGVE